MTTLHQELLYDTIAGLSERIRSRRISPVEITQMLLERIETLNPRLNAYVTVTADLALAQAKAAEVEIMKGEYRGPLHGIPIAHKDIYNTQGIRTAVGSKILETFVPDTDATVVRKLGEAGAVLLGKVQTHEFAAGTLTNSPHFGPCRNPWNLEKSPGGSSGGSGSAVAAGLAYMGTGTDTGGSVRIPAAACGIVGLKPTYGRVSRHGIFPLSWSLDHAGPLTRSTQDAAICLQAMAGYDPLDDTSADVSVPDFTGMLRGDLYGITIGIPSSFYYDGIDPEVEAALQAAMGQFKLLGANVIEVEIPLLSRVNAIGNGICMGEVASIHEKWYREQPEQYGPDVRGMIEGARLIPAVHYLQAQRARRLLQQEYMQALSAADVLLTPTLPATAPGIHDVEISMRFAELTMPTNVTGLPSLAMPCGFSAAGMPISMQLIGKPFAEAELIGIGHAYEQSTDWHFRHPELD
ncbi:amidase [Paenibacillus cellulositrophicus]|uniref:amidase n=1 Tax=Paenibacillus cellulositrophicus TaxID=562959 RepID=UPI003F7D2895